MVKQYLDSGLTIKKWCELKDIKLSSFTYLVRKTREKEANDSTSIGFVEFTTIQSNNATPILILIGEVQIELKEGFDKQALREAVQVLKSL